MEVVRIDLRACLTSWALMLEVLVLCKIEVRMNEGREESLI